MTDNTTITSPDDGYLTAALARHLMAWHLTYMPEADLRALSQEQLLDAYITRAVKPTLAAIYPEIRAWALDGTASGSTEAPTSDLWPYSARSGLIEPEVARAIRVWALRRMSEAELNSYSQMQLVHMYLHQHIIPAIQKVCPWLAIEADGDTNG